ncbi:MAG: GNAT family N-acetyltransferase [Bacteroidia bacterium]|nr:GNAT family N-acetyltransferase [Bacteroidia bacterium]
MNQFSIIEPTTEKDLSEYYRIRYEILRKPWNQSSATTKDDTEHLSVHLLVKDEKGQAVATGRMQFNSPTEGQIRSMAVIQEYQGNGIGSLIIQHLEKIAGNKKIKAILLDARENAVPFYLRNGYEIVAPSYLLFGEIKHFRMQKIISKD